MPTINLPHPTNPKPRALPVHIHTIEPACRRTLRRIARITIRNTPPLTSFWSLTK
jgi:hypothetical protein